MRLGDLAVGRERCGHGPERPKGPGVQGNPEPCTTPGIQSDMPCPYGGEDRDPEGIGDGEDPLGVGGDDEEVDVGDLAFRLARRLAQGLRPKASDVGASGGGAVEDDPVGLGPEAFQQRLERLDRGEGLEERDGGVLGVGGVEQGLPAGIPADKALQVERLQRVPDGVGAYSRGSGQLTDRKFRLRIRGYLTKYAYPFDTGSVNARYPMGFLTPARPNRVWNAAIGVLRRLNRNTYSSR